MNVARHGCPTLAASRPRLGLRLAGIAAGGAAGFTVLRCFDPRTAGFFPPCPFHWLTGCWCPGCGSTRALHALAHADLAGAWRMNALLVCALPALAVLLTSEWLLPPARRVFVPPRVIWIFFVVTLLFWIGRNVPVYPLTLLAPH